MQVSKMALIHAITGLCHNGIQSLWQFDKSTFSGNAFLFLKCNEAFDLFNLGGFFINTCQALLHQLLKRLFDHDGQP